MTKKHLFIINPMSFPQKQELQKISLSIEKYFAAKKAAGHPAEYSIQISEFPRDAIIVIREYVQNLESGAALRVYSIGGDGTAFCCLNGIIGLEGAELALIPYGVGNDFIRALVKVRL
jgi:diacylglycerol kinase family enzyme